MSIIHYGHPHERWGRVPLCGRADWEALTDNEDECECWECHAIAGTTPEDPPERGLDAYGTVIDL